MRTVFALVLLFALAPAAHAQQRSASTTDPAGDTDPGATDLVSLQATYDPAGSLQIVVAVAEPFADARAEINVTASLRGSEQCDRLAFGRGELRITVDPEAGTASGAYDPDSGAYVSGTSALSGDGRTLTVALGGDAIAGREFACVLASGKGYDDQWGEPKLGDSVFVQFPGYEKPHCGDGIDNDDDGDVDEVDQGCEDPGDESEVLERLPTIKRGYARNLAEIFVFKRLGTMDGLKMRCVRRSRVAFRCRARGAFRGTTLIKRVRVGGGYDDVARRFRIRRR